MMIYSTRFSIVIAAVLLLVGSFTATAKAKPANNSINITYGKTGRIAYDLSKGTLAVYEGENIIFKKITASVKLDETLISSKDNYTRKYTKTPVSNGFGKGIKHVVTLSGKNLPEIQQVFYTYAGLNYFLTEITVSGKGIKTNYMVPFEGSFTNLKGDTRSIFMPFDNDTFISYNAEEFKLSANVTSAEAGVVYDNISRRGLIAASVEHEVWKTGVTTAAVSDSLGTIKVLGGYTHADVTRDKIEHGYIKGNTIKSPLIMVGYFTDWRDGLEAYGKANRITEPPFVFNWTKPTPVGWNSWGVLQAGINYENTTKVADFFADSLKTFRTGNTAYIDLDSFWDNMVHNGDYSRLKAFADYCKSKGLEPGIYWAPFADWGWQGGPERDVDGSDYKYGDIWTKVGNGYHDIDGARAIDPTHPGTQKRIAKVIGKMKECGFKMIKIDFLGHAAVESTHFYDTTVTTGMQAYRKGMEWLVTQLGDQMLIYAAISPNLASGRYVHSRRIACDAFKTISDTRYTLNSVTNGWWQTYLYNYIDADHIVFGNEPEGANRARLLSGVITGTFIAGDNYSASGPWSARAKKYFQNAELLKVVKNGKAFRPVDGNAGKGASGMFTRKIGSSYYVAVFNYDKDAKHIKLDAARVGLDPKLKYAAVELLEGGAAKNFANTMDVDLNGTDAVLYKFDVKS